MIVMLINLAVIGACIAVAIQAHRFSRLVAAFRAGDMAAMVAALDRASAEARAVLVDYRQLLAKQLPDGVERLARAEAAERELAILVELADAAAERLVKAREPAPKPVVKAARRGGKTARAAEAA